MNTLTILLLVIPPLLILLAGTLGLRAIARRSPARPAGVPVNVQRAAQTSDGEPSRQVA